MKKISTLLLFVFAFTFWASAQSFEGVITFDRKVGNIVNHYKYFVKGDKIRVEEVDDDGSIVGIQIVNNTEEKVYGLSPERKLYVETGKRPQNAIPAVKVDKTGETKTVAGYKCKKVVVTSAEAGTKATYWIAQDHFDFFVGLLKTMNRKEKLSILYLSLEGFDGGFPMIGVEQRTDGTEVSRLEVKKVEKKTLKDDMFKIPTDYKKFER